MFNHPTLLYLIWRDAEREARRNPDQGGGDGWGGCLLVFVVIFMCCVFKAAFEVGGFAIVIAFAMLVGLLQGLFGKN